MKKCKFLFFYIFLTLSSRTLAYTPESGNVSVTLGPFAYKTNSRGSDTGVTSPYLGGLGLLVTGDVNSKGSLEIAMFDLHKIYIRQQAGQFISEVKEIVHITMGYRWWLNPYFSTSLTFFSSYSLGDPVIIHSDFPIGAEIDTSARNTTLYGFDFAVQSELWSQKKFAVVADARYSLSITKKPDENSDHYGIFLGLRYLLQEKRQPQEKPQP